jgi:branched-subunit amino acid aminotransferase/4-amino-4-deoxychorismate lyase
VNHGSAELDGRPVSPHEWQTLALTNYGHFTTFRVDSGRVRGLTLHLDRLDRDCRAVFGVPLDPDRAAGPSPSAPLTVRSAVYARDSPEIKSAGLFGALRQRRAAQADGYDDVLFTDGSGRISEGCTWNIGFHDGVGVIWPDAPCLTGGTMRLLRDGRDRSAPVSLAGIGSMRAAFATNAAIGVRPITRIDDVVFPESGLALDELRTTYAAVQPETL